ncbi:hypothetical protein PV383_22325 [Streptomyces caniscabiei]|uniref:Uncharacterized protein n=1 Tax=Streptomyces caniscabiei TaxID=2746961 RepID=A0ABU4MS27_9ACTN|nr:hypothetical protein [Streptomyces caniscabiei]MDX2944026.1 hypothetical protein [Streptomyces caniscabiei]MDX2950529.1 hypothetical protein [Streptomyces caniscabiei]MDX2987030.1 hypothetical protein [Streptomyces caniscabiei]MDX3009916.1 hypothetical protein [Streptomyces caniscabiei]MDX3039892.1 hypothetical protein [Streptomyces caniscabiei]
MQQGVGGVSQEDLGGGGRPQGLLVTDVDDMAQRVRALLVGDADSPEIAGDEDVDRLAQPAGEVTHDLACLARHLPLAAGQIGPAPQAGAGDVVGRVRPQQAALLQGLDQAQRGRLGQSGGVGDLAQGDNGPVLAQQVQDCPLPAPGR